MSISVAIRENFICYKVDCAREFLYLFLNVIPVIYGSILIE